MRGGGTDIVGGVVICGTREVCRRVVELEDSA